MSIQSWQFRAAKNRWLIIIAATLTLIVCAVVAGLINFFPEFQVPGDVRQQIKDDLVNHVETIRVYGPIGGESILERLFKEKALYSYSVNEVRTVTTFDHPDQILCVDLKVRYNIEPALLKLFRPRENFTFAAVKQDGEWLVWLDETRECKSNS